MFSCRLAPPCWSLVGDSFDCGFSDATKMEQEVDEMEERDKEEVQAEDSVGRIQ